MKKNRKGFTLIELLAVVVILAILMGIGVGAVTRAIENSKRSATVDTLEQFISGVRTDFADLDNASFKFVEPAESGEGEKMVEINEDFIYFVPWKCISLEKGGNRSGFSSWEDDLTGVFVTYDEDKTKFDYGVQFVDNSGHWMAPLRQNELQKPRAGKLKIKTGKEGRPGKPSEKGVQFSDQDKYDAANVKVAQCVQ